MTFLPLLAVLANVALAAGAAPAGAAAGVEALGRGDNALAVRQITDYLLYGGGTRAERERAYVRRAQAFLAEGRGADALTDAKGALALDPRDAEAVTVRGKAEAMTAPRRLAARPTPGDPSDALNAEVTARAAAVAARNRAAFADHQAQVAEYEAAKAAIAANAKAANDAYAASLAAHQAAIDAIDRKQAADMADWQARVKACKSGDRSQCAKPPREES